MTTCDPAILLQHADHLDHIAAVGGYLTEGGVRVTLDQPTRERWARDAALFRQIALEGLPADDPNPDSDRDSDR